MFKVFRNQSEGLYRIVVTLCILGLIFSLFSVGDPKVDLYATFGAVIMGFFGPYLLCRIGLWIFQGFKPKV